MRNDFYEPDRGSGVIGWAVKQAGMWLVGGLAVYAVVSHGGLLFRSPEPATKPRAAATVRPDSAQAADTPAETLQPLGQVVQPTLHTLSLRAQPDGYAYVKASVNGMPMTMAFDTGASVVSLTQADAIKAGVAGNLTYSQSFRTANGRGLGAPVVLREIQIGQLVIENVQAVVMQNMQVSLLGQTFLSRLHSYQMQDGMLTLTWQQ